MSALSEIVALTSDPDPYRNAPDNLAELQLEAARERFGLHRDRIKILDRRARDAGVSEIRSMHDLVPLLFVHTNYKSYPESFLDKGQWGHMNLWLQTLTSHAVEGVDLAPEADADDWLDALAARGHHAFTSSGTSGKVSFLDQSDADIEAATAAYRVAYLMSNHRFTPNRDRTVFIGMPPKSTYRVAPHSNAYYESVARPGDLHRITETGLKVSPTIEAGKLRRAIATGTARPAEIAAFEAASAAQRKVAGESFQAFVDKIAARRHEPMVIGLGWGLLYELVRSLRARGIPDGDFHPDLLVESGGGVKGANLPPDYRQQIDSFFGLAPDQLTNKYGMTEMTGLAPYLPWLDGYAFPPWVVPLVLDKAGEVLLNPPKGGGQVEGRMALYDLASDARWGGLISGDKVVIDFSDVGDGLKVPLVRSVARYSDLDEGEDKLTCAGTIDAYVRGEVAGGPVTGEAAGL